MQTLCKLLYNLQFLKFILLGNTFTCCLLQPMYINCTFRLSSIVPCSSIMLNCSRPDPPSLLEALQPVFKLSSIRPVMDLSNPTNVSIDFTLFGILGVDEKAQVLKTFIWQELEWRNNFVRWDPEQCGSTWITIPRKLLWVPDVVINEFMEKNSAPFVPYSYLFHDGLVIDKQPVKVISSCRLDIYTFPFDIQNCSLSFNPYIHLRVSEAPGHPVRGEPADPQLLPHHSGPLQLPSASQERRQVLVQDDPHPGLHRLPAHHERHAACHWKHHTSHKCVPVSVSVSDGGESTGDYRHHQPAVWLRSLLSSPSLGPSVCHSHPGPPGVASSKAWRPRGHGHPKSCRTRNDLSGGGGQGGSRTEGIAGWGQGPAGAEEPGQGPPGHPPPGEAAAGWKPELRGVDPGGFHHRPPAVRPLRPLHISQLHYHHHHVVAVVQHIWIMILSLGFFPYLGQVSE
ncbi:uncharacterized protein LOC126397182 isoform X2 [Epinephelus moara]|uniref:uncharacterized protein LOC126397182 isoform X2 n=1 Tax=Epinephelus moara TaxID=300413 RepID=UPI00214E2D09|nr:uncharacterized protein LOC126397182 isoform X2 [Epinephelus moara]